MEVTVVEETVRGDRVFKKMSDGRMVAEPLNRPQGSLFGTMAFIKGEVTEEKLAKAKEREKLWLLTSFSFTP